MKENKNNELKMDSLEQVAGGDGSETMNVEKGTEDILAGYGYGEKGIEDILAGYGYGEKMESIKNKYKK